MPTLGQLLGALMSDITHARRISDECAVRLAEYYQSEPLLQGLPIPRVRLSEVVIEFPVIVDGYIVGSIAEFKEVDTIANNFCQAATNVLNQQKTFIDEFETKFQASIQPRLVSALGSTTPGFGGVSMKERVFQSAQDTFDEVLRTSDVTVSFELRNSIQKAFRLVANIETFVSPAMDASISVKVESNDLKNHAKVEVGANTLTNLRVVVKEEEITWSHIGHSDGTRTSKLHPQ